MSTKFQWEQLKERNYLYERGEDGKIILESILTKPCGGVLD
jgi:hypothetical protein